MEAVQYGSTTITYMVTHTDRKTLSIEVHPDSSVQLIAPFGTPIPVLQEKIVKRGRWIVKQQMYFEQFLPHTPVREYVSGETHYYLGKRYMLKIEKGNAPKVKLKGGRLVITTPNKNSNKVKSLLAAWYYSHARKRFEMLFEKSMLHFATDNISPSGYKIKRMNKRWGSCTAKGVITLNPELIKSPSKCIEYVMIHELCHLIVHNHTKEFYNLLDEKMPDWKRWKEMLDRMMV